MPAALELVQHRPCTCSTSLGRRPGGRAPASTRPCRRCSGPGRRRRSACSPAPGRTARTRRPSHRASSETSSPTSRSSITSERPASPNAPPSIERAASLGLGRRLATTTALAGGEPVGLDDAAPGTSAAPRDLLGRRARRAARSGRRPPPYVLGEGLRALEPRRLAAGPEDRQPEARSGSARPATSGASGPITTAPADRRGQVEPSTSSSRTGWHVASSAMPGLPGAASARRRALRALPLASACSRPPEPTRQTFTSAVIAAPPDRIWSRRWPDAHQRDRDVEAALDELDVLARGRGSSSKAVMPSIGSCQPGSDWNSGSAWWKSDWWAGKCGVSLPSAAGSRRTPGSRRARQHVELGQHELGEAVDPDRVAQRHGRASRTGAAPSGHGAELAAELAQPSPSSSGASLGKGPAPTRVR